MRYPIPRDTILQILKEKEILLCEISSNFCQKIFWKMLITPGGWLKYTKKATLWQFLRIFGASSIYNFHL
jgi:hypothetical protein